jgi:DNA-binding NarL/FixJ family response regulator
MSTARIRLLLIDDHPVFRLGLVALMRTVPNVEIVGEGATTREAVELAARVEPDVILMDVRLRVGTGIEACREIRSQRPDTRILMLTTFADQEAVVASLLAGASGYLLKDSEPAQLIAGIEAVARGESLLDTTVIETVLTWMRGTDQTLTVDPLAGLSAQERNILPLIAMGKINREIAATLSLSEHTIKTYISNILQKLQLTRRSELAAFITRLQQSDRSQ